MRKELKDFIFSSIAIAFLLSITFLLLNLLSPFIARFHLNYMSVILYVIVFLSVYGLLTSIYLRLLHRVLPMQQGCYDMKNTQFTIWKHHAVVGELGRRALIPFFPFFLRQIFFSLLGAKIGKDVAIGGDLADPLLVELGDLTVIGQNAIVTCHAMALGKFIIKPVVIKKGATVGGNALILPGVEIGENSVVGPGAVVTMDTRIPPNEFWGGVPAKKIKNLDLNDIN